MKKLRDKRGVTMMEFLCSIVIVLLSTAAVTAGVHLAVKAYRSGMATSQAKVLCSTLTTTISDKLRYCGSVEIQGDNLSQIFIQNIGSVEGKGEIFQIEEGMVMLGGKKLLGSGVYPQGIQVSSLTLRYEETTRIFTVSIEISDAEGNVLAKNTEFQVKRINLDQ